MPLAPPVMIATFPASVLTHARSPAVSRSEIINAQRNPSAPAARDGLTAKTHLFSHSQYYFLRVKVNGRRLDRARGNRRLIRNLFNRNRELNILDALHEFLGRDLDLHPRQRRADTAMDADTECHLRTDIATIQVELTRAFKLRSRHRCRMRTAPAYARLSAASDRRVRFHA